jgi:hypothetical protein
MISLCGAALPAEALPPDWRLLAGAPDAAAPTGSSWLDHR